MKRRGVRPSILTIVGLLIITLGWAASAGLTLNELLIPVLGVVTGLTALTALVSSGPNALL